MVQVWPAINSHFGYVDLAGYLKDDAHYFGSQWLAGPSLHLAPDSWEYSPGNATQVWAYTNANAVELFLNGKSVGGKQAVANFSKANWTVSFEAGNLTAVGFDSDGARVATDTLLTPGAAVALSLHIDAPLSGDTPLIADGQDVALLTATVRDAAGLIVHRGTGYDGLGAAVSFVVTGDGTLLGTGNRDPTDHTPDGRPPMGSETRAAWDGVVRAIVQSSTTAGDISVTATSPGLKAAKVTLRSNSLRDETVTE